MRGRSRWTSIASLLFTLVALLAPGWAVAATGYRVTGQAVSARDGAPVPYCRISATPAQAVRVPVVTGFSTAGQGRRGGAAIAPGNARTARSGAAIDDGLETKADATGHFTLELPRAGAWALRAEARGFRAQAYDEHEGFFSSIVLTPEVPEFSAQFRLMPDGVIRGRVLDEAGDPVAHGQVLLQRVAPATVGGARDVSQQRPAMAAGTQTDDQGEYELAGLASGVYRLRVQAQPWYAQGARGIRPTLLGGVASAAGPDPSLDMVFPTTWYPAAMEEDGAEDLTLGPGEERQADVRMTAIAAAHLLLPRGENAGVGETGRPRPMRPVTITRVGTESTFGQMSFAGGNGRDWDFGSLAPGLYEVRIPGATPETEEVRQVEVRAGSNAVTLEGSATLTQVTVRCEGECGERVPMLVFEDVQSGRRITANLRMRGRKFDEDEAQEAGGTIVSLPPHRYVVGVYEDQGGYVTGLQATGAKVMGKMVEIGSQAATLTVQVGSGRGEVRGTVSLAGKSAAGAMVLLVPVTLGQANDRSVIARDQSNSDGSYNFAGVLPGQYILVALDHGWAADWRTMAGLARYLAQGTPVEVGAGAKVVREIAAVAP